MNDKFGRRNLDFPREVYDVVTLNNYNYEMVRGHTKCYMIDDSSPCSRLEQNATAVYSDFEANLTLLSTGRLLYRGMKTHSSQRLHMAASLPVTLAPRRGP